MTTHTSGDKATTVHGEVGEPFSKNKPVLWYQDSVGIYWKQVDTSELNYLIENASKFQYDVKSPGDSKVFEHGSTTHSLTKGLQIIPEDAKTIKVDNYTIFYKE
eukprot:TRINITY_DN20542_c0_g1_i1.p1 TRINITY_DN20542_c0_g1~~TRINITY_DN20542_c0_g1_i1.p1  ORF type:complete len:104 (-),score=3.75 TRINITY_DN20542_c0_g1_i1:70-381(-)